MALPQGVSIRASLAYVTDPADTIYEASSAGVPSGNSYPTTSPQGNTVGWETDITQGLQGRDRNAGNDARIAGTGFSDNAIGGACFYRIDLPSAGNYNIRVGCGDASYARPALLTIKDNATPLAATSVTATTAANKFRDATDAEYAAADWPSMNTAQSFTFTSNIVRFFLFDTGAGGALCFLAHFFIETGSASGVTYLLT